MALYGHSLGSLICLRAYAPEVATMVLTGALTDTMACGARPRGHRRGSRWSSGDYSTSKSVARSIEERPAESTAFNSAR